VVALFWVLRCAWGNPHNRVYDSPILAWVRKIGVALTICAAATNILTLTTPAPVEVVLNFATAANFISLAFLLSPNGQK
jgi:hypothetical protein